MDLFYYGDAALNEYRFEQTVMFPCNSDYLHGTSILSDYVLVTFILKPPFW